MNLSQCYQTHQEFYHFALPQMFSLCFLSIASVIEQHIPSMASLGDIRAQHNIPDMKDSS